MALDMIFNPGMLAFSRSLETTEAVLYGSKSDNPSALTPIEVVVTGQRGQSSQEKLNREAAGKSKAGKSNPQEVEIARMPNDCDMLVIKCGLRVMPNTVKPSSTNDKDAYQSFRTLAEMYADLGGYSELAARYAENLANGRFAWRNRSLSNEATVEVAFDGKRIAFDPFQLEVGEIMGVDAMKAAVVAGDAADVDALVAFMAGGLATRPVDLQFSWNGKVLPNAEVYPSQEYKYSEDKKAKGVPSRLLASVRATVDGEKIRHASMHAQKIGAALRAVDDWHEDPFYGAIPVNPYGGVQEAGVALRHRNKAAPSLYDLAKKPALFMDDLSAGTLSPNAHFFMACLVRGGVYGSSKED